MPSALPQRRGVLPTLAGDEGPPAGPIGPGAPNLGLGAVDAKDDVLGGGVGEHVLQGVQSQAGPVGDGESAPRQEWADLADGAADGEEPISYITPRASWVRPVRR